MSEDSQRTVQSDEPTSESTKLSQPMSMAEPLPKQHTPYRKRKFKLGLGIVIATLDLCCKPTTYFYALNFDTNLSIQDGMVLSKTVKIFG
jgi:hypothetical protein